MEVSLCHLSSDSLDMIIGSSSKKGLSLCERQGGKPFSSAITIQAFL